MAMSIIARPYAIPAVELSAPAWSHKGIPYVTDSVPSAIMPILPTGADDDTHDWAVFYDPCGIAKPVFTGAANQYYADSVNGDDGSAGNSGRGSEALPRKSLPNQTGGNWTLAEGEQVYIVGGSQFFNETSGVFTVNGTGANPCWVIGVDSGGLPIFNPTKLHSSGQHLLVDGIDFKANVAQGVIRFKFGNTTDAVFFKYGILRNCTGQGITGGGATASFGGAGLSISQTTEFICFYNNDFHTYGEWDGVTGTDKHIIQYTFFCRHWWIIDNDLFNAEGDSIQIGVGMNDLDPARRPHYNYIAGNLLHENFENGGDTKGNYHTIFSENTLYGFEDTRVGKSANDTALLLHNNDEGPLASHQWAIFNELYDIKQGIAYKGDVMATMNIAEDDQLTGCKGFMICNLIYDARGTKSCRSGITINGGRVSNPGDATWNTNFAQQWVVNNTIVVKEIPLDSSDGNGTETYSIVWGNILVSTTNHAGDEIVVADGGTSGGETHTLDVRYNLVNNTERAISHNSNNWTNDVGNLFGSSADEFDPLFTDPSTTWDFTIGESSPAKNLFDYPAAVIALAAMTPVAEPLVEPYTLFENLYGIDIKFDFAGNARPASGAWSAGAYE